MSCVHFTIEIQLSQWRFDALNYVVLNRWPRAASGPHLHYVFHLGQQVYTGTCLHANDTQTTGSFTVAVQFLTFTFVFGVVRILTFCRHRFLDCTKMMCCKFSAKRKVDSKKNGPKNLHSFSLQPGPMCLICQETIAVMKISNLK